MPRHYQTCPSSHCWITIGILALLSALFAACQSGRTPAPPLPTNTLLPPTETLTATPVWFPPTATQTPFPTLVITPTQDVRPLLGELLLEDYFSAAGPWVLGRTDTTSAALGQAELTLALNPPSNYLFTVRHEPMLTDFYLEIDASPSICRGLDEYGLLLRFTSAQEFYRFSLSCDGQARVDKYYQGTASSPRPWEYSGLVPPGAPSRSRLAVWAQGRELNFYANGGLIFSVSDPSITQGYMGLFVRAASGEAVTVSFSELSIWTLK